MEINDWEKRRDEMADKYRDDDFAQNPNGYSVSPRCNRETTFNAATFGADWARADLLKNPPEEWMRFASAGADVFEQLLRGKWKSDEGHDVPMNAAMLELKEALEAIAKTR